MAFAARAANPTGAGMIVMPDVRGLHTYYKELATRFAEAGVDSIAIDYFGRTAPSDDRGESFEFFPHVGQTRLETMTADVAAAAAYLRSAEGGAAKSLFTIGFCFGGSASALQAAGGHGLSGVVSFYGWPLGAPTGPDGQPFWRGWPAPIDRVADFECPVLALYGGADEGIPPTAIEQFDQALDRAGVEHETKVYAGAPHSFLDRRQTEFADASADAWQTVLAFIKQHA
jgi:carboxymethylenebutenolidase